MLVADVISFIGSLLTALHLSLANPVQQPVRRSVLSGRRPRAPDTDEEGTGDEASPHGRPGAAQQHQGKCPRGATTSAAAAGGVTTTAPAPSHDSSQEMHSSGPAALMDGSQWDDAHAKPVATEAAADACAASLAVGSSASGAAHGAMRCSLQGQEPAPSCSEQPTLPASPRHERLARGGDVCNGAAPGASPSGFGISQAGPGVGSGGPVVPRKIRKVLDGPMQRTKSVVSVPALSHGAVESDDEACGDGRLHE